MKKVTKAATGGFIAVSLLAGAMFGAFSAVEFARATNSGHNSDPTPPSCPSALGSDLWNNAEVKIDWTGQGPLKSDTPSLYERERSVTLAPGKYTIHTVSWDGYEGRENAEEWKQRHEQWHVRVENSEGDTLAKTDNTTDIKEGVREDTQKNKFEIEISETGTKAVAAHAAPGETVNGKKVPNSVHPICIAFVRHEEPKPEPVCTLDISRTEVTKGEKVTLTWTSDHADTAELLKFIGGVEQTLDDNLSPDGSTEVTIDTDGEVAFKATFYSKYGKKVTCSKTVKVTKYVGDDDDDDDTPPSGDDDDDDTPPSGDDDDDTPPSGGRGPCLNCGDDDDDDTPRGDDDDDDDDDDGTPNITLDRNITPGAPAGIFLDQVPYTGFEAGPVMTALFWFGVFGLSALVAYAITMRRSPVGVVEAANEDYRLAAFSDRNSAFNQISSHRNQFQSEPVTTFADLGGKGSNSREEEIEARAHNESILLSPEALRAVVAELDRRGEDLEAFTDRLFEEAKGQFVREDGWILLSKERVNTLLGNNKDESTARPVRETRPEPRREEARRDTAARVNSPAPEVQTEQYEGTVSTVTTFITWLAANEQQKVYNFLRKLSAQGYSVDNFISQVIRALDDVYKNRLEGNRNPDPSLAEKTATWSNADLESILGILVECVDYSYSSSRIGTKVALAKVFEYLAQRDSGRKQ